MYCIALTLVMDHFSANTPSYSEVYEWEDESYLTKVKGHEDCPHESNYRHKRTAVLEDDNLWPNATIPYLLTGSSVSYQINSLVPLSIDVISKKGFLRLITDLVEFKNCELK